jgi:hypothetical protein
MDSVLKGASSFYCLYFPQVFLTSTLDTFISMPSPVLGMSLLKFLSHFCFSSSRVDTNANSSVKPPLIWLTWMNSIHKWSFHLWI